MQAQIFSLAGEVVGDIEISDAVFAAPVNGALMHQAVLRQQANARQGTHSTKTRGDVAGSTRKLYRQKGTGNARAGSAKSPLRYGGGVVFGPHPRDYRQAMPKRMRRLALRSALSAKVRDGELKVVESVDFPEPRTKQMSGALDALNVEGTALVVTSRSKENVVKSARNIPGVKTLPADLLNVLDILRHDMLLMEVDAVRRAEQLWGSAAGERAGSAEAAGEKSDATA